MTRIGIFGGSFDPPHLGHTLAMLWALETGEIDRILMIPVARHAFGKEHGATFPHRLQMCRLATHHLAPYIRISTIEAEREGPSYTIDTLRALAEEMPDASFRLLIGSDNIGALGKWKDSAEVVHLAPPLELPRPDGSLDDAQRPGLLPNVSSSHVREVLARRGDTAHLLSHRVRTYIDLNRLYLPREQ